MYAPHTQADIEAMLAAVGVGSLDELLRVPEAVALKGKLEVVPALPEYQIQRRFAAFAEANPAASCRSFLGAGAYRHYAPPAIAALVMRGEFLTAYTPYQAEVSQGYLQAIYEWQTYICLLTGMEIANASVYDGATALAEGSDHGAGRDRTPQDPRLARHPSQLSRRSANVLRRSRRRRRRDSVHRRRGDRSRRIGDGGRRRRIRSRRFAVAELLR